MTLSFLRDSLGRVVREESSLFPTEPVRYTLNSQGQPSALRVSTGNGEIPIFRDFDSLGRVRSVSLGESTVATYDYSNNNLGGGAPIGVSRGNGLREDWLYDGHGRRLGASTYTAGAPTSEALRVDVQWRDDALVGRVDRTLVNDVQWNGFLHDWKRRLTDEFTGTAPVSSFVSGQFDSTDIESLRPDAELINTFAYDQVDNRTVSTNWNPVSETTTTYSVGDDNRYTSLDIQEHYHGLFTQGRTETILSDESGFINEYDGRAYWRGPFGNVTMARNSQADWDFRYDPFGRLVQWKDADGETRLQYAGAQIIRSSESPFQKEDSTVFVPGAASWTPVALYNGVEIQHVHRDWKDRIAAISDGAGAVVERYTYSGYGTPRVLSGATGQPTSNPAVTRFLVAGQPYFPEFELQRFGARWYSPKLGRFMSPDPLGYADGPNFYAFVGNQPLHFFDPFGLARQPFVVPPGPGTWARDAGNWIEAKAGYVGDAFGRAVSYASDYWATSYLNSSGPSAGYYAAGGLFTGVADAFLPQSRDAVLFELSTSVAGLALKGIGAARNLASAGLDALEWGAKKFSSAWRAGRRRWSSFFRQYEFDMVENPGPLANMSSLQSMRESPAQNFAGGKYNSIVLEEDLILYRGGQSGGGRNALGQWFSREPPSSVAKVRIDSAVKSQWINPRTGGTQGRSIVDAVYEIRIPAGTTLYEGPIAYQGGVHVGGQSFDQVFVPEPWKIPGVGVVSETPLP